MSRHATRQLQRSGFALALHIALTEDGLTTEKFARSVDVTLRTAQRWRGGESEPMATQVAAICRVLDRPLEFFYPDEQAA